ncbi:MULTISPECIES: ketosteroid isomerase-related protein [Xanthomonas]|uniref:Isopropylmalate/homocitrate/citramalate synthase n=1 Tax=Xanthomonas cucurbitae TaxID=56453 RepID=A0A2S7DDN5_9XANT|nr:ketosteroid isomerase-related protein [Xanthomonas cucurbitae]PPU71923.1 isopropylmalate/homocitrate/citramalate synthase [Xanthomonas cucurbitae]QHG85913.1 isopropylmalate/homocitrate/citramalate synthase [Xanthomonas cucurbitae]WDM67327.1 nuclear transport factor 2 family protein [Xanthomonas cucurbitae]WDM71204.1 nuclear transport factor 2 family protein [Xanthomonas cucurbitae]WDM75816.1 nuclear transport factor 2 family protein [Xanthomonas cucurbitae]
MPQSERQRATGLVQAYYAAFNRSDWGGMLALLSEDVAHDLNQGPREIGRADFAVFLKRMHDSYHEQLHEIVVTANEDGTRVGAEYVVHGVYHSTDEGLPDARGQTYVLPGGAFFEIRKNSIVRVTNYYNLQEWIAQVSR